ncbi:hypothetical protein ACTXT7_011645 [Hymenolepis weldensis]
MFYINFSELLIVESKLPSKDNEEERGLRVICNDSDRLTVIWPDPPEVQYGYYAVEIKEMKQTKYTSKPIELEFINLLPFTNCTVSVYDYYDIYRKNLLGSAFAHTLPEVPDPAEFVNCTSNGIVVKLKRNQNENPKDYYYTSKVRKYDLDSGKAEEVGNVQCDQSNGECKFENLFPYTPYGICGNNVVPEVTPKNMKITSRSVSVSIDYEMRDLAYSTVVFPAGTNPSDRPEIPCGSECTIDELFPNTAYEISLRVCLMKSGRSQCSNWSSPYKFYTDPDKGGGEEKEMGC